MFPRCCHGLSRGRTAGAGHTQVWLPHGGPGVKGRSLWPVPRQVLAPSTRGHWLEGAWAHQRPRAHRPRQPGGPAVRALFSFASRGWSRLVPEAVPGEAVAAAGGLGAEAWPCCLPGSRVALESPGWVRGSAWPLSLPGCRAGVCAAGRGSGDVRRQLCPQWRRRSWSVPHRARAGPRLGGQLSATASVPRTSTRQSCLAGHRVLLGVGDCDSGKGSLSGQSPGPSWLGDPGRGRE